MANPNNELAELASGKSDEEIYAALNGNVEGTIDQVVAGMVQAFQPASAGDQEAVMQYELTDSGGATSSFQLQVKDGACSSARGEAENPRVTLKLTVPDFLRLTTGELDGQQAFFSGKLQLDGDMMFAQTMRSWFKKESD